MMLFFACVTAVVLLVISAVHVYWAFGGVWPAQELAKLPQMVAGSNDTRMPPMPITLVVAVLIAMAGLLPLMWVGVLPALPGRGLLGFSLLVLVAVFLGRGVVTYTPIGAKVFAVEPFNTLNRKYFSPLCIAIGLLLLLVRFG